MLYIFCISYTWRYNTNLFIKSRSIFSKVLKKYEGEVSRKFKVNVDKTDTNSQERNLIS